MRHAFGDLWRRFQRAAPARRHCERRPAVEALEERAMLAAAPYSGPHDLAEARPKKPVPAYQQTNLLSDDSAQHPQVVDTDVVNPWGIAFSTTGPFWICENGLDQAGIFTVSATGTVTPSDRTVGVPPGS